MAFDSTVFLIFYAVVFSLYWSLARFVTVQNFLILIASYVFYAWWDWRFLGLIALSTLTDYVAGRMLDRRTDPAARRVLVGLSIAVNLGILGFFKYFNFFAESFADFLAIFGMGVDQVTIRIILPVGISFYTFQSMAYTIDVYRGRQRAETNPITFFGFIAFFPQLVAGPIERASHLLPQFGRARSLNLEGAREGIWLAAYGFFLKEVLADSVGQIVNLAFVETQRSGWMVVIGTLGFGVQIYADFLAYSLIARGCARLLGFELSWNFNRPYLATSVREFWHRWHMSLSTWLRDYLYIPLGGDRGGSARTYVNLMLTMVLGGLWHGAAWNFVAWGLLHGLVLCAERAVPGAPPDTAGRQLLGWLRTMLVVFVGWFLFRCDSAVMVSSLLAALGDFTWRPVYGYYLGTIAVLSLPAVLYELAQTRFHDPLPVLRLSPVAFGLLTGTLIASVFVMFQRFDQRFIYFQF